MIRVLQIVDNIATDRGVAAVVMNLYRNIDREKVQFDFLVCNKIEDSYEKEILEMGGNIFYVNNPLSLRQFKKALVNIKSFFIDNAQNYPIAHLHSPTIALFTMKYAKKYGIQNRIVHSHSSMTSPNRIKAFVNLFLMSASRKYSNVYWACSTEAALFLFGKKSVRQNEVELIKNAIDPQKFHFDEKKRIKMREKLNITSERIIVHVSNFAKVKNVLFLVPVIKELANTDVKFKFLFVGDGPEAENLKNEIKQEGLENEVVFVGRVNNVNDYLQASDLLVLPSLKEGLPVSVVEAQACGLRCLVNSTITREANIGGVRYKTLKVNLWSKYIISDSNYSLANRYKLSKKYRESSFNLSLEAKRVMNMYLSMIGE